MKQRYFLQFILGILFSSFFIVACDSTDLFDTSTCIQKIEKSTKSISEQEEIIRGHFSELGRHFLDNFPLLVMQRINSNHFSFMKNTEDLYQKSLLAIPYS